MFWARAVFCLLQKMEKNVILFVHPKRILKRIILLEKSVAKNIEMAEFSLVIAGMVLYNL